MDVPKAEGNPVGGVLQDYLEKTMPYVKMDGMPRSGWELNPNKGARPRSEW